MNTTATSNVTIQLIRHGQASAGTDHYDRLSTMGRTQAELLGASWQNTGTRFDAVFHGSLERQRDTAALALSTARINLTPNILTDLNEYDHDAVDDLFSRGARSADLPGALTFADYVALMARWRDATATELASVESFTEFGDRCWGAMENAVARTLTAPDNAARGNASNAPLSIGLFTSGGVIASILTRLLQLDFESSMHAIWQIRNASVTTLHYRVQHGGPLACSGRSRHDHTDLSPP